MQNKINKDDLKKITRLEVIDENGRSYVNLGVKKLEFNVQDEGRTLKIFINSKFEELLSRL